MTILSTYLITIGIISSISIALTILIIIAEATIANYGEVKIKINDEKELNVIGGRTLLKTLSDEKIFIPSACGGQGSCGLCKVKVLQGVGVYLPTELPWISEEEQKENIRLSCQIKAKTDLHIQIPDELFNIKEFTAKIISLTDLTYDIKRIQMQLSDSNVIKFKAGQFIQFQVPEYELSTESVYRAYSIASQPSSPNIIDLMIRLVPNGICTTYVHKHLKEGDYITINGPYGEFFIRDSENDMIFIAGGSGMAPIRSILLDMIEKKSTRNTTFFFGARTEKDLFLTEELRSYERKLKNFKYIPAVADSENSKNWKGETGLITDIIEKHIKHNNQQEAYLCGSPGMINACVNILTKKGIQEKAIYYDKFA